MPNVYAFGKTYINLKYQGEVDIQKKDVMLAHLVVIGVSD